YKFTIYFKPTYNRETIKGNIKLAFPLGIVVMIVSLNTNLPRILIEAILNTKALGYFTSVFYLVFVGSKFINAMGNAMLPRLAQLYDEGKESQFNKLLFKLIA